MAKELTVKIKNDYGTVKRFCKENDINYKTYNVVASGFASSERITQILISHGYIKDADELVKVNQEVVA